MRTTALLRSAVVGVLNVPAITANVRRTLIGQIAQKTEDAFYICDVGDIINKYNNWNSRMPRVTPFYAMKSNAHPIYLQMLAHLGAGYDCASKEEIGKILGLGVSPDRIIFANPCKPASHLRFAADRSVDLMTFDNEVELTKIKQLAPNARLVLRIRADNEMAHHTTDIKFGIDPVLAPHLLEIAFAMNLNVVGVSFHVGSGCFEPAIFCHAVEKARAVFDEAERLGKPMTLLDIGGGFPGDWGTSLQPFADKINGALDNLFPENEGVQVIAEPGRYFAASALTLATHVTSVRHREDAVDYYINDGVYGAFNCRRYNFPISEPRPLHDHRGVLGPPATIWGPTCDSSDRVLEGVDLPPDLSPGSWLVWDNMGAYSLAAAGTFNGFPCAPMHAFVTAAVSETVQAALGPQTTLREWELPYDPEHEENFKPASEQYGYAERLASEPIVKHTTAAHSAPRGSG